MKEETIRISGMTCQHCVMAVRKELTRIDGVTVVDVGIGTATVRYDESRIPASRIAEAIREAGYEPQG